MATREERMKEEGLKAWKERQSNKQPKQQKQEYIPLSKEEYRSIAVGDIIVRQLVFLIPMQLKVMELTEDRIICGFWEFDRNTGLEIDEDISHTVSYISEIIKNETV
jgi:hypothetical protein